MTNLLHDIAWYESPAGWIEITAVSDGISSLVFREPLEEVKLKSDYLKAPLNESSPLSVEIKAHQVESSPPAGILAECVNQLSLYFEGKLKVFDLPLAPTGTPFQRKVWDELVKIPYGQVITYRNLAIRVGGPTYTRIVGQANSHNPISILIPCHRVIGMNGSLIGYAGGLWRKKFLLEMEQKEENTGFRPTLF
jgi:methylated-DNA-[protein]-cysteine S-methyltransferase